MMKEEYKSLVGMDVQKWAKSPVMSNSVRPYPLEKEQITLVFSDGSNVTVSEKEDGSGELVWEWSEKRVHLRKGVLLWQKTKDSMILQSTGIRRIEVFSSPFNGRQWLEGQ